MYIFKNSVSDLFVFAEEIAFKDGPAENSETSKISEFFSDIFKSEFWILPVGKNRKLVNKKIPNNFSEISEISDFSKFQFAILSFFKNFFFNIL